MNKLLKYFSVLSIMLVFAVASNAQGVHLKKHVLGSGSMIASENGTDVRLSGTYNQTAVGKLEIMGTAQTGDLYIGFWEKSEVTGVDEESFAETVSEISNFPNPASSTTKFKFDLPEAANVSLRVYDVSGKLLKVVYSGFRNRGLQEIEYNLTDNFGQKLNSGTYMYELSASPYNAAGGGFEPFVLHSTMVIQK